MSKELVIIEPKNALAIFTQKDQLDEIISQVEMEVATFEHDLSNESRRKKTASLARKVSSTKTYLDGLGKDLVSDWKAKSKAVDANRKDMRDRLDELRDLARKPLTDWEAEDARIKAEEAARIEAEKVKAEIERDHEMAVLMNAEYDRQAEEAFIKAQAEEELRIEAEHKARLEREALIAKQAKEKAEREAAEREAALKREAEEAAAKAEADRLASLEREKQAYREKIAAEERARVQAQEAALQRQLAAESAKREAEAAAERGRLAEIQRQKDLAEEEAARIAKLEADKRHVGAIRKAAKESIMALGVDEKTAKSIVLAIHNKNIANVHISY